MSDRVSKVIQEMKNMKRVVALDKGHYCKCGSKIWKFRGIGASDRAKGILEEDATFILVRCWDCKENNHLTGKCYIDWKIEKN
jgi:hypothetical protein